MTKIQVLGVDPASGKKGSALFDGQSIREGVRPDELRTEITKTVGLVTWDAPLTGPPKPDGDASGDHDLTKRPIEKIWGKRVSLAKGVSVRGYAGLSHWVIRDACSGCHASVWLMLNQTGSWSSRGRRSPGATSQRCIRR